MMASSSVFLWILSYINAAIKFLNNIIAIEIRVNLTKYLHKKYISGDNFYRANIDSADSRLVHTIRDFSDGLTELFSRTFQPILNFAVINIQLYKMGFKSSLLLYGYAFAMGSFINFLAPP